MRRWREFDAEFAKRFGTRFFLQTGDVIYRDAAEPFTTRTLEHWRKLKVPHEELTPDEARKRWPMIDPRKATVILYEPDAGVARARHSVQALAAIGRDAGVKYIVGRAKPGALRNGRMQEVTLDDGTRLTADAYVFACGPWLRKVFPALLENRMRTPLGHVCYFGPPEGDTRFTYPNLPSWNVPGVTGWAALPVDSRGFRVRGGFAPPAPGSYMRMPAPPVPSLRGTPPVSRASVTDTVAVGPERRTLAGVEPSWRMVRPSTATAPSAMTSTA